MECFGFYFGGVICKHCELNESCKNILISHGFEIMEAVLETLVNRVEPGYGLEDTDRIPIMIDQLLLPPKRRTKEEEDLLQELEREMQQAANYRTTMGIDENSKLGDVDLS